MKIPIVIREAMILAEDVHRLKDCCISISVNGLSESTYRVYFKNNARRDAVYEEMVKHITGTPMLRTETWQSPNMTTFTDQTINWYVMPDN